MKKFLILILATALVLPNLAQAKGYLDGASIDPNLIDRPLAPNSAERKNEIQKIIKLQQNVDAEELRKAKEEAHIKPEHLVLAVDPSLTRERYPKFYNLLDKVQSSASDAAHDVKSYWNVTRPFVADKKIKALADTSDIIGKHSYPSGHTTVSFVLARVCGLLLPQKREAFYARADEIASHRVLVGMHFSDDLKGGRQLALIVVGGLIQNVDFEQDFKLAQQELTTK